MENGIFVSDEAKNEVKICLKNMPQRKIIQKISKYQYVEVDRLEISTRPNTRTQKNI